MTYDQAVSLLALLGLEIYAQGCAANRVARSVGDHLAATRATPAPRSRPCGLSGSGDSLRTTFDCSAQPNKPFTTSAIPKAFIAHNVVRQYT